MKNLSLVATSLVLTLGSMHSLAVAQVVGIERFVQVGSTEPGPQSPSAARQEAVAALAVARRECAEEPDQESRQE